MFPWSVIPIAGICNRCASASIGLTFAAPSSIEYSVWLCRCTKEALRALARGAEGLVIGTPVYDRDPTDLGVSRCVSLPAFLCRESARVRLQFFGPRPPAPQHAFDARHRPQLPTNLGENPCRDESGDEDREPDAHHAEYGIRGRALRNRVFPSLLQLADP